MPAHYFLSQTDEVQCILSNVKCSFLGQNKEDARVTPTVEPATSLPVAQQAITSPVIKPATALPLPVKSTSDILKSLASKVDVDENAFFIIVRRKASLSRVLTVWQRQAKKTPPTRVLKVHYCGEDGIDDGAIRLEFLANIIEEMGKTMFPDGSPVNSTFHVQNGNFRTCGELVAVSLAQGGPAPCFLEQCVYNSIFEDTDMEDIKDSDLTSNEQEILAGISANCNEHVDFILENGYTGPIDQKHIDAIVNSVKVCFISRRILYMREFAKGLNVLGLWDLIRSYPDKCQPLFLREYKVQTVPDANYVFSLRPNYSNEGSSRRVIEESIMDHFHGL